MLLRVQAIEKDKAGLEARIVDLEAQLAAAGVCTKCN